MFVKELGMDVYLMYFQKVNLIILSYCRCVLCVKESHDYSIDC